MTHVSTRRSLLKAGGSLVVGFSLGVRLPLASAQPVAAHAKPVALDEVDSYLAIGPDGRVTVFSGKVDLGTGVRTALTQMAADELDLGMDRVTVVQGDTLLTPIRGRPTAACPSRAAGRRSGRLRRRRASTSSPRRRRSSACRNPI